VGEATFYLKARFGSEDEAKLAVKIAKYVLDDLAEFHDDWQRIRSETEIPVKGRDRILKEKHPLVAKLIELPEPRSNDVCMNYLAGRCEMHKGYELYNNGEWIYLSCICWHLASWDNIEKLFIKLGAIEVGWISDEDFNPFDAVPVRIVTPGNLREVLEEIGQELLAQLI